MICDAMNFFDNRSHQTSLDRVGQRVLEIVIQPTTSCVTEMSICRVVVGHLGESLCI